MKRFIHQYRVQILLSIYQSTINQSEQEPISTSKYPSNTRSNFQLVSKSIDKHRYLSQNRVKKNHLRFISKSLLKSHFLFRTKQKKKEEEEEIKRKINISNSVIKGGGKHETLKQRKQNIPRKVWAGWGEEGTNRSVEGSDPVKHLHGGRNVTRKEKGEGGEGRGRERRKEQRRRRVQWQ